jgi:phytoene synthase
MTDAGEDLAALPSLLSVYAGREGPLHRLIWRLDQRFARLVATTTEPMIGQMRLAWWNDALTDESGVRGRGEPVIDALRELNAAPPAGLSQWLDGWEALIGDADLSAYAAGRGGGLFRALAGQDDIPGWLEQAGMAWALWDLSGHIDKVADEAIAMAHAHLLSDPVKWPKPWRPLRIAYQLAHHDIKGGRRAPPGLTPALYMRLIRLALLGR